jgi:hypothetical protein
MKRSTAVKASSPCRMRPMTPVLRITIGTTVTRTLKAMACAHRNTFLAVSSRYRPRR